MWSGLKFVPSLDLDTCLVFTCGNDFYIEFFIRSKNPAQQVLKYIQMNWIKPKSDYQSHQRNNPRWLSQHITIKRKMKKNNSLSFRKPVFQRKKNSITSDLPFRIRFLKKHTSALMKTNGDKAVGQKQERENWIALMSLKEWGLKIIQTSTKTISPQKIIYH